MKTTLEKIVLEIQDIGLKGVTAESLEKHEFIKDAIQPKYFKSYGLNWYVDYWKQRDGKYKFNEIAFNG